VNVEWDRDITLEPFKVLYDTDATIILVWGGRDSGKSFAVPQILTRKAMESKHFRCMGIRSVYNTVRNSIFDRFTNFLEDTGLSSFATQTKSPLEIRFNNGADILGRGCDDPAKLKSTADPSHAWIEEADQITENDFDTIFTTLRSNHLPIQIFMTFNPEVDEATGTHWIKDRFFMGWSDDDMYKDQVEFYIDVDSDGVKSQIKCLSIHVDLDSNPHCDMVRRSMYDSYKDYDENKYRVWRKGWWGRRAGSVVYKNYDPDLNDSKREVSIKDALHIGMDFNVEHMAGIVHIVDGGKFIAVDEFVDLYDTDEMCRAIRERYPNHQITAYPDASGKNRHSSGNTDHAILREFRMKVMSRSKNPFIRDRITEMNRSFWDGVERKYLINKGKCPIYSTHLMGIRYKNGEPDKSKGMDHTTDAGGYFITGTARQPTISGAFTA
jgi:PBSX family phage terminase large subunit